MILILNELFGEPGGARTRDHRIKSAMLYQLSYRPLGCVYCFLEEKRRLTHALPRSLLRVTL
jgi:hypothetical protein